MLATSRPALAPEQDLRQGLDDLRCDVLSGFSTLLIIGSWLWFAFAIIKGCIPGTNDVVFVLAIATVYGVHRLRGRYYEAACWLFLLSSVVIIGLIMLGHPSSLVMVAGVTLVIAANALLSARAALLSGALTWASTTLIWHAKAGPISLTGEALAILLLYLFVTVAGWLALRPLRMAVKWALTGWTHAHEALDEVQRRRGELYRALRALEEATYRVERMNNELLIAQRDAEEARAAKARLAATVSHELRGPLSLVLGFSRLMALSPESYGEPLPRAYRADVDAIYRNTQHLVALVDDILDLSQIEAERLPLVKDRIDLDIDVVTKVIHIVEPLAERKGLYLCQKLAGNLPCIVADSVRLRQALLNLLTNAVRFTEQGGITVRTARHEEGLLVTVQDTGPGIPVQDMPKLFKEFSQITPAKDTSKGSGLGLAISKHLIELHGGHIWAESGGIGTTFHFTVPLIAHESQAANFVRVRSETSRSEGLASCLVIHHDPGIVRLVARYIDDHRIVGLPNETEVVSLVEQLHPRAIITVPELADRVLECLESTPWDVPLITCAMPGTVQQAHLDGVISYLIKPIMPEALVAVMRKVERNGETTVLLVDDDPDAVRLMERMLTCLPRPYRILKAYSGFQAFDLMREQIPDVVLMDLVMPELDGRETIRRMRADERLQNVPVVIISARDWIEHDSVLGTTLTIRHRHAVRITQGARCLQALLKALTPGYLSAAEGFLSSATASLERSAFAALR